MLLLLRLEKFAILRWREFFWKIKKWSTIFLTSAKHHLIAFIVIFLFPWAYHQVYHHEDETRKLPSAIWSNAMENFIICVRLIERSDLEYPLASTFPRLRRAKLEAVMCNSGVQIKCRHCVLPVVIRNIRLRVFTLI